jgi:hypothetical protein
MYNGLWFYYPYVYFFANCIISSNLFAYECENTIGQLEESWLGVTLGRCQIICIQKWHHNPKFPSMNTMISKWGKTIKWGKTPGHYWSFLSCWDLYVAIDSIITEFDSHFNGTSSEFFQNLCCLNPRATFARFNANNLALLIEINDEAFSDYERCKISLRYWLFIWRELKIPRFVSILQA